jgi:hypothetical protein
MREHIVHKSTAQKQDIDPPLICPILLPTLLQIAKIKFSSVVYHETSI